MEKKVVGNNPFCQKTENRAFCSKVNFALFAFFFFFAKTFFGVFFTLFTLFYEIPKILFEKKKII